MKLKELTSFLNDYLKVNDFKDWSPNGLQVEGRPDVNRIVLGVTASQRLLDVAVQREADAVIVHHGYFWKGEDQTVVGMKKKRIETLLKNDISLLAYHLPLDANEEVGNNKELADHLGLKVVAREGEMGLLNICESKGAPIQTDVFLVRLADELSRQPMVVGPKPKELKRIGLCSGAAQDMLPEAAALGCDVFISGEISERTTHEARELGIMYISAGHHATERYGIQALGKVLQERFPELEIEYVDDDNPV